MSEQQTSESFRGSTFSPAEQWHGADAEFAHDKIEEVRGLLMKLARDPDVVESRGRFGRRRWRAQREYDLEDASRTLGDASHVLKGAVRRAENVTQS